MTDSSEKGPAQACPDRPRAVGTARTGRPGHPSFSNQILVELAMDALDRREWPSTEVEMRVARASLFTAQAIAFDLIAAGREKEVQEIRDFISTIVPDPDSAPASTDRSGAGTVLDADDDSTP